MKESVAARARELLAMDPVFLDTETTGLGPTAEIVEICIIDADGDVLLDSLVKPTVPISQGAEAVHGISEADLVGAPSFADLLPAVQQILKDRSVIIYNAAYDVPVIQQSARAHGLDEGIVSDPQCAMLLYAEFAGVWNDYRGDYRWHKLIDAARQCGIELPEKLHRAKADTELTRQLLMYMASTAQP